MILKNIMLATLFAIALLGSGFQNFPLQKAQEPWSEKQLLPPAQLARALNEGKTKNTFIYNIGPAGHIKNAIEIGDGRDKSSQEKLRNAVSKLPKDADIVIYCGCCPFKDCPNVRPTFKLLSDLKFTNHKLLNLSTNLKVDWINKGYPMRNQ